MECFKVDASVHMCMWLNMWVYKCMCDWCEYVYMQLCGSVTAFV